MSLYYSQSEHDEALAQHGRLWDAMHELGRERGRDTPEYREARDDMREAAQVLRTAARRQRRGKRADGKTP